MVDAPCSRIGHIYRKFAPFPNPGVGDFVGRVSIYHQNNIRICSQSNKKNINIIGTSNKCCKQIFVTANILDYCYGMGF
jgi:hypothetical protein